MADEFATIKLFTEANGMKESREGIPRLQVAGKYIYTTSRRTYQSEITNQANLGHRAEGNTVARPWESKEATVNLKGMFKKQRQ